MDPIATLVLVGGLAAALGYSVARLRALNASLTTLARESSEAPGTSQDRPQSELQQIVMSLGPMFQSAGYASDFLSQPEFERGVEILTAESCSVDMLLGFYTGDNAILAFLGLEALARRRNDRDVRPRILDGINDYIPWTRFFALRVLDAHTPAGASIAGTLLARVNESWDIPLNLRILREFLQTRKDRGETLSFGESLGMLTEPAAEMLNRLLARMPDELTGGLREELRAWRSTRIDFEFLDSVGRMWSDGGESDGIVLSHEALDRNAADVESMILRRPHRSVLLIGEHGVGKSAIVRTVAKNMAAKGWSIFQAGHAELIAGMSYVGQFEERLQGLLGRLTGRRVLWVVEDFHGMALAGRHQYSPRSALDFLLPHVEKGDIVLLGETTPGAFERVLQSKPRVLTAMDNCRVNALTEAATLELVDRWAETFPVAGGGPAIAAGIRREAWMLAQQYLGDRAAPGNVLKLLELTRRHKLTAGAKRVTAIEVDDLIATLGQLTGLPSTILDERRGLDLTALRRLFAERVMGQPEAMDCLVERVAMIKAGVTDPTRPLGVFLFAGPTGTGKTEIAKTLAQFLFGSPDRMIRLDMSEFQDPESLNRILGESNENDRGESMVDMIRKKPFSVVLLDEFEKAHPNVWDLFLQVFDDGRLTDRLGIAADFRNAIVIMTSNLGGVIPSGSSLGFADETGRFSAASVLREVDRSFRREFLNRIDRVVVFRPLARETMREILRKELAEAFHRRGLRNRTWAVEWDESALEFLLERGFTADLGARPLKRAVERYVLAPLATTIVNHQYPEGDQFLFVRSENDGLTVEFVDPDAPEDGEPVELTVDELPVADDTLSLGRIALEPRGRPEDIATLRAVYDRLASTVESESWQGAKRRGLERTREPKFWESADRHTVLGQVEYLDRIEAGLKTAGSLLERLSGSGGRDRRRYPRDLVGRLASRLFLLDAACHGVENDQPREAFVLVEAWSDAGTPSRPASAFARRLGSMYRSWSERRGMQCDVLEASGGEGREPYRLLLAVSGYAAYSILETERGLHLLEISQGEGKHFNRVAAHVRVAPQPDVPPAGEAAGLLEQARVALAEQGAENVSIVRRYREEPSPLVRDSVRGWRTGKLDRVLRGDFDLLGGDRLEK